MQDQPPYQLLEEGVEHAQRLLRHQLVQNLLLDTNVGYDAVVAEWYYSGLLAPLAALYECPLIWYSTLDPNWMTLQLVHGQTNPAYAVDFQARNVASPPYTITSRLQRLGRQIYMSARMFYTMHYVETPIYDELYRPLLKLHDRIPSDYESLVYNGSLLLVNSHPLVGQTLPLPANVKYVGGHHLEEPTKPLPQKLQAILDSAKHGVILFSLRSHARSQDLIHHVKYQLLQMFEQLEQTVIWTIDKKLDNLPENVFTFRWVPQTSILNHSNTILFINNGGLTSLIEATYYGVPVIGIPLVGDQFVNIDLAQARDRAIIVNYSEYLAYTLKSAINEILGNNSYRINAKAGAELFQNRIATPQQELLYYINLVISTKGASHLRSRALELSTVQRLYLDVVILLLLVLWFLSKVLKVIQVHMKAEDEDKKNN
ncbi:UDP-glucosyltransferase 2 isoform X2 [Manduca sexta]|nr:UDP-glucosyltransferase 2 isoform X2 [Manduca sexta]